ncbi:MAG: Activator of Hsp90 ATPase 1 family protein [Marmoricola sp.]|nr:Activator of Hsp90 ATPase 1 family protein [Marmoricola sp.]
MTETTNQTDSLAVSIEVAAPAAHTFETFTQRMETWWDPTHHLLPDTVAMRVEPHVGGTITDIAKDGSTCTWGRVLAYAPPVRFTFTWDISLQWEVETDLSKCSEVDVTFTPVSETQTRVDLVHRHLERHGEGWQGMAQAVGSPTGWPAGLQRLAIAART